MNNLWIIYGNGGKICKDLDPSHGHGLLYVLLLLFCCCLLPVAHQFEIFGAVNSFGGFLSSINTVTYTLYGTVKN